MPELTIKIGSPENFSNLEIARFLQLLIQQDKVVNPSIAKISRCKILAAGFVDDEMVCIGAIKPKTASDFTEAKANLSELTNFFEWEIGYFFTKPKHEGNKYSSQLLDSLINDYGSDNLMASTEIRDGNRMINALENRNFVQMGQGWLNSKATETLRLFLKMT